MRLIALTFLALAVTAQAQTNYLVPQGDGQSGLGRSTNRWGEVNVVTGRVDSLTIGGETRTNWPTGTTGNYVANTNGELYGTLSLRDTAGDETFLQSLGTTGIRINSTADPFASDVSITRTGIVASAFYGSGAGLTDITGGATTTNADDLVTGTLSRPVATTGSVTASNVFGDGAGLKSVFRTPGWAGALADMRINATVPRIAVIGDSYVSQWVGDLFYQLGQTYGFSARNTYEGNYSRFVGSTQTGTWTERIYSTNSPTYDAIESSAAASTAQLVVPCSTARIIWGKSAGGTFSVTTNGQPWFTVSTGTSGGVTIITFGTEAEHTIVCTVESGTVLLSGIEFSNGRGVIVDGTGVGGSPASGWPSIDYTTWTNVWRTLDPDLVILNIGVNDFAQTNTVATYKSSLSNLIVRVQHACPNAGVLFLGQPDIELDNGFGRMTNYALAVAPVASALGADVLLLDRFFGPFARANALGMFSDTVHPSVYGYRVISDEVFKHLTGGSTPSLLYAQKDTTPNLSEQADAFSVSSGVTKLTAGTYSQSPYYSWFQTRLNYGNGASTYPLVLNPLGGPVGIAKTNPDASYVLDAAGNVRFGATGKSLITDYEILLGSSDATLYGNANELRLGAYDADASIVISPAASGVAIGKVVPTARLDVDGGIVADSLKLTNNLTALGSSNNIGGLIVTNTGVYAPSFNSPTGSMTSGSIGTLTIQNPWNAGLGTNVMGSNVVGAVHTASNVAGASMTNLAGGLTAGASIAAANGSALTNLNASNLASGIVPDARLTNSALLNGNNTFTGSNKVSHLYSTGAQYAKTFSTETNYTFSASDTVVFVTGTNVTITLPNCTNTTSGRIVQVVVDNNYGSAVVTNANGVQKLNGALSQTLGASGTATNSFTSVNTGSNWP